jgi:nucleoid DNA-binding protein
VTKDDLIRDLHERLGKKHTLKDLTTIVDATFDVVADGLGRGDEIQLADFGTFSLADKTIKSVIKTTPKKKS